MLFITLSSNFYISPHQSETHVKWHCRMGDTNVFHSLMRKSNENGKKNKINRKWNSMKYKTRIIKLNRKKKKKKKKKLKTRTLFGTAQINIFFFHSHQVITFWFLHMTEHITNEMKAKQTTCCCCEILYKNRTQFLGSENILWLVRIY